MPADDIYIFLIGGVAILGALVGVSYLKCHKSKRKKKNTEEQEI